MILSMYVILWGLLALVLVSLSCVYLTGHFRRAEQYHLTGVPAGSPHFLTTVASLSDSLVTHGSPTRFWSDIDALQTARLALISRARQLVMNISPV